MAKLGPARWLSPKTRAFKRVEIDSGAKCDMWFTMQSANAIGHLATKTGKVTVVQATAPRSRPYGILLDNQQHPWVIEFGTNKVAALQPRTTTTLPQRPQRRREGHAEKL